jgi:hypothetical protein
MASANAANAGAAANASTKIYNRVEELGKQLEENDKNTKMLLTELLKKVNTIETKMASVGTTKARSAAGSKGGAAGGTIAKKKFPTNSLTWFKEAWKSERAEISKLFFKADQLAALEKHMTEDPKAKEKKEDAKTIEETRFLWDSYVAASEDMRKKIKKVYDDRKKAHEEANKTPVSKEKDGEDEGGDPAADGADE